MLNKKIYFIIFYENGKPFLSIPTFSKKINKDKLLRDRNLNKNIKIKVEKKDKFIGW
jgi:hypothetical protein